MGSVNKVILVGRLSADPEVRHTQAGAKIVNFRLACSEQWRDKGSGEKREKTEWIPVVVFNDRLATVAETYLRKGSQCYVEGQLQTRSWEDRDGNKRYTTEVVLQNFRGELTLLDSKGEGERTGSAMPYEVGSERDPNAPGRSISERAAPGGPAPSRVTDLDDSIPFAPQVLG